MNTFNTSFKIIEEESLQSTDVLIHRLIARRSVHPRRLVHPGPDRFAVRQMIEAAVTAIDHGGLRPWRFISITGEALVALGNVFVEIKLAHNKDISVEELDRERNRAQAVPVIVAVIDRSNAEHNAIPIKEQHASIGAAIQNIVLTADLMGFGAKMVSGKKVTHSMLGGRLDLSPGETVFGFVCLGTSVPGTSYKQRPDVDDVLSVWNPGCASDNGTLSLEESVEIAPLWNR